MTTEKVILLKPSREEFTAHELMQLPESDFIKEVMKQVPNLTYQGFQQKGVTSFGDFEEERQRMLSDYAIDEFERSSDFLAPFSPTRSLTEHAPGSYYLKHLAEDATGDYICNGMLICAAISLGLRVKRCHPTSPNALIGISITDLKQFLKQRRHE